LTLSAACTEAAESAQTQAKNVARAARDERQDMTEDLS